MVKNWGDSDDEEEEVDVQEDSQGLEQLGDVKVDAGSPSGTQERTYECPTEPPYTAYVGNLAFSITDGPMFIAAMTALVTEQLHVNMNFTNGRLIQDTRYDANRHRGFGYIDVETIEDLQRLMELNHCPNPYIAGRRIVVDTSGMKGNSTHSSRPHQQSYNNNSNNNNTGDHRRRHSNASGSNTNQRRNSSRNMATSHTDAVAGAEGSKFRGGRHMNAVGAPSTNDAPLSTPSSSQRPVLILKPRSKALDSEQITDAAGGGNEGTSNTLGNSSSSIFGNAKARDEQSWRSHKQPSAALPEADITPVKTSNSPDSQAPSSSMSSSSMSSSSIHQKQPNGDMMKRSGPGRGGVGGRTSVRGGRGQGNIRGTGTGNSGRGNNNITGASTGEFTRSEPRHHHNNKNKRVGNKPNHNQSEAAAVTTTLTAVPPPKPVEPERKAPKPTNTFAALALDDSDSD
jgi:hypothetical protein